MSTSLKGRSRVSILESFHCTSQHVLAQWYQLFNLRSSTAPFLQLQMACRQTFDYKPKAPGLSPICHFQGIVFLHPSSFQETCLWAEGACEYYISIVTMPKLRIPENITSLLPSVLLRVRSTSNNANSNERVIFFPV